MTSCASLGNWQNKPKGDAICPSGAFIDTKDYEAKDITSKSDKEFKLWAADLATKYPQVLNAYDLLEECWVHYHGKPKAP